MPATSIVLVGGKSTRLGKDKITELIGGESLLQRVLARLATFSTDIILVTAQGQALPEFSQPKTRIIEDLIPDGGSLGGIYSGLQASSSSHNLLIAGDMPFLNVPLLQYLLEISPPFDVVVPQANGFLEPLHAVYSQNCVPQIRRLLEEDNHKILDFFPQVKVKYVEEGLNRFDPKHLSLFNINTREDLAKARQLVLSGETVEADREIHTP